MRTQSGIFAVAALSFLIGAAKAQAQQVQDTTFSPHTGPAAFGAGMGPRILIDGGHHNFHTVDGRYSAFAKLARRDGYRVSGSTRSLSAKLLEDADIVVIANALAERNDGGKWSLPTPSAFTPAEIEAVRHWVDGGGSLLLIADHMPFAGATEAMGAAFGITYLNGFAYDAKQNSIFRLSRAAGLDAHPIFDGRNVTERVDSIVAFTGSAFILTTGGTALIRIPDGSRVLLPNVAWQFSDSTASVSARGMLQGAALSIGKGRVVVAGEAAMFSAQRSGPQAQNPMGFNDPTAPQNAQFVVNTLHWLSRLL